jgi:hypothetical protein
MELVFEFFIVLKLMLYGLNGPCCLIAGLEKSNEVWFFERLIEFFVFKVKYYPGSILDIAILGGVLVASLMVSCNSWILWTLNRNAESSSKGWFVYHWIDQMKSLEQNKLRTCLLISLIIQINFPKRDKSYNREEIWS